MTADPLVLTPAVERATRRLLETVDSLDDSMIAAPSRLAGWTRGHVLSHLARNADSYLRLAEGARTGVTVPQYPSRASRDAEIEAGAGRTVAEHRDDLERSSRRLIEAFRTFPDHAWTVTVRGLSGRSSPAAGLVWWRLLEVEVHHVDLALDYRSEDWEPAFTLHLLHDLQTRFERAPRLRLRATDLDREFVVGGDGGSRGDDEGGDTERAVLGDGHALAAWIIGRTDGATLTVRPPGALPELPSWA